MNMAYIVDNYEDGMKLMATDTFKGWDADLANNGICGLCYNYYDGARSFMGHKPYKTPADLKGAVIRTPVLTRTLSPSPLWALPRTTSHGLRSTTASRPSPSTAAKSSTPPLFPARSTRSASMSARPSHINLFNMVICGQAWFDKLPAEYQEVMKKDFNDCAYNNAQDIIAAQDTWRRP